MGYLILLFAGLCQGSFGLGYKNYRPFAWPVFWGIYDFCCIITSLAVALISAPKLFSALGETGAAPLLIPLLCGGLWGLSAIGFSKGIDKIGMSLVYGISMGISTIVGSVLPMLMNGNRVEGGSAVLFSVGLVLTVIGVVIVTVAGIRRDGGAKSSVFGVVLSVLSGLGSGAMNVGFSYAEPIGKTLISYGYGDVAVSAGKWLPVLVGGCVAGIVWCFAEALLKKQIHTICLKGSLKTAFKLLGVSFIWYAALLLYGLSSNMLGEMGGTVGWILFNALALIVSVFWGLKTGEWKNAKKGLLFIGCGVLIAAWIFTALV